MMPENKEPLMKYIKYLFFPLILTAFILMDVLWVTCALIYNIVRVTRDIYQCLKAIYE
jgi:hypothetical protein